MQDSLNTIIETIYSESHIQTKLTTLRSQLDSLDSQGVKKLLSMRAPSHLTQKNRDALLGNILLNFLYEAHQASSAEDDIHNPIYGIFLDHIATAHIHHSHQAHNCYLFLCQAIIESYFEYPEHFQMLINRLDAIISALASATAALPLEKTQ